MKIIIDTEKRNVEVPKDFKETYDAQLKLGRKIGQDSDTILLNMLNLKGYKVFTTAKRQVKDKTNKETIDKFMEKIKDTHKDLYQEYIAMKEKQIGTSKKGKPMYTNFLTIKKWFYEKFPEQSPFKNEEKGKKDTKKDTKKGEKIEKVD